jgi:hypothetical protein
VRVDVLGGERFDGRLQLLERTRAPLRSARHRGEIECCNHHNIVANICSVCALALAAKPSDEGALWQGPREA